MEACTKNMKASTFLGPHGSKRRELFLDWIVAAAVLALIAFLFELIDLLKGGTP